MKTYNPAIQVHLIKTQERKEFAKGVSASQDRFAKLKTIDLTPYLGDAGSVHTTKGVREPAGAFSISFADKPHVVKGAGSLYETIYALVEPMDVIEIRMAHEPHLFRDKPMPIVMRGIVSNVTRSESMANGKPIRTVTISGQDFGKILQILRIYYLNNSVVGDNILSAFSFFQKYARAGEEIIMSGNDFLTEVAEKVINKYLGDMLALASGKSLGDEIPKTIRAESNISGCISPYRLCSIKDTTIDQLLRTVLDVGAFNEMFIEDRETEIVLVVRPVPFREVKALPDGGYEVGSYIQKDVIPANVLNKTIRSEDVVSINVSRGDSGVYNYFWVSNAQWMMMHNETAKNLTTYGDKGNFLVDKELNTEAKYYGFRKLELDSSLGDPAYTNGGAEKANELTKQTSVLGNWLAIRRAILAKMNRDNVVFESGNLRLRGNEGIKAGCYLDVVRGTKRDSIASYYVTSVMHEFSPFKGFFTNVTVERGTGWINRGQAKQGQFYSDVDSGGVA